MSATATDTTVHKIIRNYGDSYPIFWAEGYEETVEEGMRENLEKDGIGIFSDIKVGVKLEEVSIGQMVTAIQTIMIFDSQKEYNRFKLTYPEFVRKHFYNRNTQTC